MARVSKADLKAPVRDDDADQAELDRAYEEMYGKVEDSEKQPESMPVLEDDEVEVEEESTEEANEGADSDELEDDQEEQDAGLDDELEDNDTAAELDDELETLDDELEEEPTQKVKLSKEQQEIVNRRVQRELKKVRSAASSEASELKAQVEMLTRLITGQQQPQVNAAPVANFAPPQPQKPFEDMNEFERVQYAVQVNQAQQAAALEAQAQREAQEVQVNAYKRVISNLKQHLHDPTIKKIHDVDGAQYFSPQFTAALSDYPNSASIMRHLYNNNKVELQAIRMQPVQTQIAAAIRMAERYNLERKQKFQQKVAQKKSPPPGKLKSAKPIKNGPPSGKASDYGAYLESLSDEQYRKLMAKGH